MWSDRKAICWHIINKDICCLMIIICQDISNSSHNLSYLAWQNARNFHTLAMQSFTKRSYFLVHVERMQLSIFEHTFLPVKFKNLNFPRILSEWILTLKVLYLLFIYCNCLFIKTNFTVKVQISKLTPY